MDGTPADDSLTGQSRFSVTPVRANEHGVQFVLTNDQGDDQVHAEIDDIGYITCERYDRRKLDVDEDDECALYEEDEAMPRETNYMLSLTRTGRVRPTILELREDGAGIEMDDGVSRTGNRKDSVVLKGPPPVGLKFGWIRGVFIRCLLNIWGVLLFMRLSWVVAQAGLGLTVAILALAAVVITITTLSMSAISTNGAVQGGGTYFLISRSLGPEFGGAVGIIFTIANAVAVGMNTVGFAEALVELLKIHGIVITDEANDIRWIGIITMFLLLGITIVGMEWEARTQLVLFGVIIASLVNFFIGSFLVTPDKQKIGIVGYSADTFATNFFPDFRDNHSFMTMFGIFFPACTGIMAGANISGDLKNPSTAIPKGTLSAIGVSIVSYLFCAMIVAAVAVRDASGSESDLIIGNVTNCLICGNTTDSCLSTCVYGIANSYQMMTEISAVGPIVTTGVFAASLSSALACLVSAPKLLQALCRDNIFPYIGVLGKGYGKNDEPRWAYLLTFCVGCGIVLIADLNAIAPIISNFYIGTYALINYACFDASLSASPGFRPAFRYYNMWLSLIGAILCLACMFMMNWWGALGTMAITACLMVYVRHKQPDVNWGSSIQARAFKSTVQSALKLVGIEDHVKNFRPQVLVLTGLPSSRPALVYFVHTFTKNLGMMVCGHVLVGEGGNLGTVHSFQRETYAWFREKHIKSFYSGFVADNFKQGVHGLIQTVGIGKMKPNTVFMGFTQTWMDQSAKEIDEYVDAICTAFDWNMGVGILRLRDGIDASEEVMNKTASTYDLTMLSSSPLSSQKFNGDAMSKRKLSLQSEDNSFDSPLLHPNGPSGDSKRTDGLPRFGSQLNIPGMLDKDRRPSLYSSKLDLADRFHSKSKQRIDGEIHVWWLYDDGGLTLLIPHILSKKPPWNDCKLKIFYLQGKPHLLDEAQRSMVALLSKFRIDFSDAVAVNTNKPPSDESVIWFNQMIQRFRDTDGTPDPNVPVPISNADLEAMFQRTQRQIRMRELLKEHSSSASLIVMTLPVPKINCNPTLYMAWLETLTEDMPPILLLRGNQQSVMTFYS